VRGQIDRAVDMLERHLDGTLRAVRATIQAAGEPARAATRKHRKA
jgi:hypothetical protein